MKERTDYHTVDPKVNARYPFTGRGGVFDDDFRSVNAYNAQTPQEGFDRAAMPCTVQRMQASLAIVGWVGATMCMTGCRTAAMPAPTNRPQAAPQVWQDTAASPPSADLPAALAQRLRRLFQAAAEVRQLPFRQAVPVRIQSRAEIAAHLLDRAADEDLLKAQTLYTALGLLPPRIDIRELLTRVLGEQVVGFYDADHRHLVVRDDLMRDAGLEADIVLVHEMVHALQDQHYGLGETMKMQRDSDAQNAFHAVVEGDATLGMLGYAAAQSGFSLEWLAKSPTLLSSLSGMNSAGGGEELASAPAIVRVTLVASYSRGLAFAADVFGRGGWPELQRVFQRLPSSTEQVLHTDKYFANEAPEIPVLPAFEALHQGGYTAIDEDSLGELELSVYLGQQTAGEVDDGAAAGWSGDRIRVYQHPKARSAIVWFLVWDNAAEAAQAAAAARRVLDRIGAAELSQHCVEQQGRALLILRWLEPSLQSSVRAAFRSYAAGLPRRL